MANFNLTRDEAHAGIHSGLKNIQYNTVIASWLHPTGAYLSIEMPDVNQGCYVIAWRSMAHYAATFQRVKMVLDADPDIAWATCLRIAETAYAGSPAPAILEAIEGKRADRQRAGKESGRVRKEQAEARKLAAANTPSTEQSKAPAENTAPISAQSAVEQPSAENSLISPEQAVSPDVEVAPVAEEADLRPKVRLRKNKTWRFKKQYGFNHCTNGMMYHADGGDKTDNTCVIFRNRLIEEDGIANKPDADPERARHSWEVSRWYRAHPDASLNGEDIQEGLTMDEAIPLINRIMETDPSTWTRGDFKP